LKLKNKINIEMKPESDKKISCPRILISALRGSSAKTIISLGITVALKKRGIKIFPYKKGPDYIDAAWLTKAAGEMCRHLDLYLMGEKGLREVFYSQANSKVVSIVEGNRGLFDGVDIHGTYSTAKVARLLKIPVTLVVDCTKTTNTIAPLVLGCQKLDPKVPLSGVILNRIAGKRHGDVISKSIKHHTGLPVLGILPELDIQMPERHLGLTTVTEAKDFAKKLDLLGDLAEKHLNLDKILKIAKKAPRIKIPVKRKKATVKTIHSQKVSVGIIRDRAFQFYYPENLESLEQEGANLIEFDSMRDKEIKPVDLLYIGGGFPEVFAEKISKNKSFRDSIKNLAEKGMPIYGECGAVIYLGNSVVYNGKKHKMCGILPLDFKLTKRPAGHGYTEIKIDRKNPFFPKGLTMKGHEFHYSLPVNWDTGSFETAFSIKKGYGFDGKRDGLFKQNVFVTYTHLHAAGAESWAKYLIEKARKIRFTKT
jgi:cobyrinic acid a,c-diamide synthase